jgi:hypothetical protein
MLSRLRPVGLEMVRKRGNAMKKVKNIQNKALCNALGKGVRDIALAFGNGGYVRNTNVHRCKKDYNRKNKSWKRDIS